jgi:hypothetical protein
LRDTDGGQKPPRVSVEILRLALQLMAPHKAAFHPLSYAVWYEHAADLNPGLSRDLQKFAIPDAPLGEPDVARLYALHIEARDIVFREFIFRFGAARIAGQSTVRPGTTERARRAHDVQSAPI